MFCLNCDCETFSQSDPLTPDQTLAIFGFEPMIDPDTRDLGDQWILVSCDHCGNQARITVDDLADLAFI